MVGRPSECGGLFGSLLIEQARVELQMRRLWDNGEFGHDGNVDTDNDQRCAE